MLINNKIVVILGPTASGKTKLGVSLARKYNGEIISADSRQVYKGMNIGSGKDLEEYVMGGVNVPYHLIDVVKPNIKFNLSRYQKLATQAIEDILSRNKLPIIVGGSGLYLQAIVDNYRLSSVKPNIKLRKELEFLSIDGLFNKLKKIKPKFANNLNNSDRNNPRRLIRYLEIIEEGNDKMGGKNKSPYNFLILGLTRPDKELRQRISYRILKRLEEGMIDEIYQLHKGGVSWKRLDSFGLEYRYISSHLQGKISYQEMINRLERASYKFAKNQKTWFKRWEKQGTEIKWINGELEAKEEINKYLK